MLVVSRQNETMPTEESTMKKSIPLAVAVAALASACTSMEDVKLNDKGEKARFVDVTSKTGIMTEEARSAGWADYDGDGCVDLLVTPDLNTMIRSWIFNSLRFNKKTYFQAKIGHAATNTARCRHKKMTGLTGFTRLHKPVNPVNPVNPVHLLKRF